MASPKLRFKGFDGDWNKNTIGNFVLNYKGGASLTPADFVEYSDCEVIPKKAISSGGLLQLDKVVPTFCTLEFFNSNQNYIVDSEYLITTLRDLVPSGPSIGYIVKYESNKKYILAQGVYGFRIKNDLNRDFLIQFSNTSKFRLHMQSIMVGSTQVHIRNQDYFSTELYTPSLIEQTKIASFLSAVDEKISQLTRKHELLSQYKQGMMQKLFSQQLRFKADDGREFGEWEEKIIGEIANIKRGASPRPITDAKWFDEESKVGWVRISDVSKSKKILVETEQYLSNEGIQKSRFIPKGNIIMSICATIGKPIYTGFDVCIHDGFVVFSELKAWYEYTYYYLEWIEKNWYQYGQSGTQVNLNSDIVSNEIFPFPCLEEQTKIANFLSAIDQKIEVVVQQIEQAKTWKKGLLQQMFV